MIGRKRAGLEDWKCSTPTREIDYGQCRKFGEYCRQRWSVGEGKSGAFEGGSGFQIFVSMLVVALSTVPMLLVAARRSIETIGCSSVGTEQAAGNQLVLSAAHQSLEI